MTFSFPSREGSAASREMTRWPKSTKDYQFHVATKFCSFRRHPFSKPVSTSQYKDIQWGDRQSLKHCFLPAALAGQPDYLKNLLHRSTSSTPNDPAKEFWCKLKPEITLTSSIRDQYWQSLRMLPGKPPSSVFVWSVRAEIPHGTIESPQLVLPMQKGRWDETSCGQTIEMSLWDAAGGDEDNDDDSSNTTNTDEICALSDTTLSVLHVLASELKKTELLLTRQIYQSK